MRSSRMSAADPAAIMPKLDGSGVEVWRLKVPLNTSPFVVLRFPGMLIVMTSPTIPAVRPGKSVDTKLMPANAASVNVSVMGAFPPLVGQYR